MISENPRILGIDYGDSRIGLSISDLLGSMAQPLKVISVKNGWKNTVPLIHEIIFNLNVNKIIIGYPFLMDGTKGKRCEVTDRFIEVLEKGIEDIEIIKWDERLTTFEASEILQTSNKKNGINDIVAAVLILQSYLDFYKE